MSEAPPEPARQVFALSAITTALHRQVLQATGGRTFWVRAEIAGLSTRKEHLYLELAEHRDGKRVAVMRGIVWRSDHQRIRAALGADADAILKDGVEVLLLARVNFSHTHGLSLSIDAVDPSFNLGAVEQRKQATLATLRAEGAMELNRACPLPRVVQHLAVITSGGSAAHADLMRHLGENEHGFCYHVQLFDSSVQGDNAAFELRRALGRIDPARFDAVVIIRGGGGKLDLEPFNDLGLARAVARMPIPVLTGIGHDVDITVVDLVAHRHFKTPTDVADHLVDRTQAFVQLLLERMQVLRSVVAQALVHRHKAVQDTAYLLTIASTACVAHHRRGVVQAGTLVRALPRRLQQVERRGLDALSDTLSRVVRDRVLTLSGRLRGVEQAIHVLRPEKLLERGFSITRRQGVALTDAADLQEGDEVVTTFARGSVRSTVLSVQRDG